MADIWVVNADGGNPHPITHGSDPVLERRTTYMLFGWTRDNNSLMAWFVKDDQTGEERYRGFLLVDADSGETLPVFSYEVGTSDSFYGMWHGWADSWDSEQIAFTGSVYAVRGPRGGEQTLEDERRLLRVFSRSERKLVDQLVYRPAQDRVTLSPGDSAPSWTSDNQHLVVTKARIISAESSVYEPDLYLVTLPAAAEQAPPSTPAPPAGAQAAGPQPATIPPATTPGMVALVVRTRRASEVVDLLPPILKGNLSVDPSRNCILVPADTPNLEALRSALASADRPAPHIMVNVLVTELSKEANRELGLDWEAAKGHFGAVLPITSDGNPGSLFWQGVGRLDDQFLSTLSLLAEQGKATVRANPRVIATSGKESAITIRRTDFFFFDAGTDYQGHPVRARSDISADTVLRITPVLLGDGRINVRVDATIDTFTFAGKNDLPDTTRRQVTTEVTCADGDSIVLGGLTQEEAAVTVRKTPLLGDIPLLGQLFRHTERRSRESTMTIFITPSCAGR
ncbi:MAG: hypothetical protein ACE149_15700 [Armatimonadota bacterium]